MSRAGGAGAIFAEGGGGILMGSVTVIESDQPRSLAISLRIHAKGLRLGNEDAVGGRDAGAPRNPLVIQEQKSISTHSCQKDASGIVCSRGIRTGTTSFPDRYTRQTA